MANFQIKTKQVQRHQSELNTIANELVRMAEEINSVRSRLAFNGEYRSGITGSLGQVADRSNEAGRIARDMGNKLGQITGLYETSEKRIVNHASGSPSWKDYIAAAVEAVTVIGGLVIDNTLGFLKPGTGKWSFSGEKAVGYTGATSYASAAWTSDDGKLGFHANAEAKAEAAGLRGSATATYNGITASAEGMVGYAGAHASAKFDINENGYIGGKAEAGAEVAALKGSESLEGEYGSFKAEGAFLSAGATAGITIGMMDEDGNLNPNISAEAEAKAAVASGKVEGQIGTDDFNVHGDASGALVGAEAKAGIEVGANGVKAEAGAEAYLAKGEVEGGFTFLGIKVDAKVEGKAGAIGAKGSFEAKEDSFSIGGSLSALVGGGVELSVDWSEFSLPTVDDIFGGWFTWEGKK